MNSKSRLGADATLFRWPLDLPNVQLQSRKYDQDDEHSAQRPDGTNWQASSKRPVPYLSQNSTTVPSYLVCYPAVAANAFAEAFPDLGPGLDLCPTEEPDQRQGWPPLPGDYRVVRYQAPVAVCTLNSEGIARQLADLSPDALAIVGTLHTENLGIERIIRNTLANPNIRFLILCGEDTQQTIGHLPGQSLQSLFENGVDERGRIRGARGKRPVLKNVSVEETQAFVEQVELIPMIGEQRADVVGERVKASRTRDPGPYKGTATGARIKTVQAEEPRNVTLDRAGYFVVYPRGTPVLASVLSYAALKGNAYFGALLLFVYGFGAGIPLLAAAAISSRFAQRLDVRGYRQWVDRATRTLLLGLGFYLLWIA